MHVPRLQCVPGDDSGVERGLNRKLKAEGRPELNIGVGLNTGPMVVGNMGSNKKSVFNYTVMGDAVNLGRAS